MHGLRISLKTLFLICLYFAICSTLYVHANLWLGTLVVVATIVWLIATTARAFNHHEYFSFGFSIFGWAWLVFWLGFYAETGPRSATWEVPQLIHRAMHFFNAPPARDPNVPIYATMHSLHTSGQMASQSPVPNLPVYLNAIRLALCVTALLVGLIGGTAFHLVARRLGARKKEEPGT